MHILFPGVPSYKKYQSNSNFFSVALDYPYFELPIKKE
jgi:hypothetical protein